MDLKCCYQYVRMLLSTEIPIFGLSHFRSLLEGCHCQRRYCALLIKGSGHLLLGNVDKTVSINCNERTAARQPMRDLRMF